MSRVNLVNLVDDLLRLFQLSGRDGRASGLRTPLEPETEGVVREVERYLQDKAKALFLFSPFTLFAVSDRVSFTAYDTCMSELAETRIKG